LVVVKTTGRAASLHPSRSYIQPIIIEIWDFNKQFSEAEMSKIPIGQGGGSGASTAIADLLDYRAGTWKQREEEEEEEEEKEAEEEDDDDDNSFGDIPPPRVPKAPILLGMSGR
jgi:hypothetical protein